jgi:hypothetical protein
MHVALKYGNIYIYVYIDFLSIKMMPRGPFISAIGRCYCVDHFTCSHCSTDLVDCGFIEENGKLYCENDFEQYLAPNCAKCSQKILKVILIK